MADSRPDGRAPSLSGPFRFSGRDDRGSAVLETAIAVPVLVAITAMMLWAMGFGVTSLALASQARDAARAIARGESNDAAAAGVATVCTSGGRKKLLPASYDALMSLLAETMVVL